MPAALARSDRFASPMRWPAMSTTSPLVTATHMPDRRFIRHATSPMGSWLHSQPSIA